MNILPDTNDPIAALATPLAESALSVIRTSGEGVIDRISEAFDGGKSLAEVPGNTVVTGILRDSNGSPIDQLVAAVFRAPKSYTGEDVVELFGHGSPAGIAKILSRLRSIGFRSAEPGEFTLRAFLNGKLGLTEAEAVNEIIKAKSGRAQSLALERLSGAVQRPLALAKDELLKVAAAVELSLDYPDDEIDLTDQEMKRLVESASTRLTELAATYRTGKILQDGAVVALVGQTNAGKSSLFNLFLKEDRSIVSEIHGTTRDYIESWIQLDGIPLRLIDTAGFRASDHPVEAEGIRRTEAIIDTADIVILLADSSTDGAHTPDGFGSDTRAIRVWHKSDISISDPPENHIPVSSVTGEGFDDLQNAIRERLASDVLSGSRESNSVIIDSARQRDLLERCVKSLDHVMEGMESGVPLDAVSLDLKDALDAIGEISGEITSADVLNQIFSDFCVGK